MYHILQGGGFTTGGLNFDAKIRRQSIDPDDLLHGHIGGMDVGARGLLIAAKMIEDGALARHVKDRYAAWDSPEGQGYPVRRALAGRPGGARSRRRTPSRSRAPASRSILRIW